MTPKRIYQICSTVAWIVIFGGYQVYNSLHPDPLDAQWVAEVQQHPVAAGLGALIPTLVLSPVIYWFVGRFGPKSLR